jgi:hypothetical protein
MRYSFDYIGHDMWHVTHGDVGSYWLLTTDTVRAFLADYYDPLTVAEILGAERFDTLSIG